MPQQNQNPDTQYPDALPPIDRKSMKNGLLTLGAVGENDMPETAVRESINFHFDAIGSATLRKGTTLLGTAFSGNMLGMYYYVDTVNASPNTRLIVVNGTNAWYLSGSSYVSCRTSLTAGSKAQFTTFLNYVFMANGTESTAVWDGTVGTSFVTTGNAASAPKGKYIENFRGRVWVFAGDKPSRLHYSSVPSAVTTPVITWNTSDTTGQWIDISPQDGDFPTGLQRFRNVMLCFKTNRMYRVFDIGQVDPDPYYAVGTSSQESILETKAGVFFHHSSGFYQYNIYGVVEEVSRPIIDIIRAIPTSAYTSVAGWLETDGDHVCWSLGNVTVRGTTYTNLVVRYTISTQAWTHYQYPTQFLTSIRRQPFYTDGTTQFAVCGDASGNVLETNTGLTDNATQIPYSLIHRWEKGDGLLATRLNIQTGTFSHIGGAGTNVGFQTEDNDPDALNDWSKRIGQFKPVNTGFNTMNIKSRKYRIRIWGQSKGEPFIYDGYELIGVTNELVTFS